MYVRPQLEYCVELWNPVYSGDKIKIERAQNKFTRMIRQGGQIPSNERNLKLGISTHEQRRNRGDMINIYKHIEKSQYFQRKNNRQTRGNSKAIAQPIYKTDIRKHSFSCRGVNAWNALPEEVVSAKSVNIFKNKLDNYYESAN